MNVRLADRVEILVDLGAAKARRRLMIAAKVHLQGAATLRTANRGHATISQFEQIPVSEDDHDETHGFPRIRRARLGAAVRRPVLFCGT